MRNEKDFYPTPEEVLDSVFKLRDLQNDISKHIYVMDPYAGDGRILKRACNKRLIGIEIRENTKPNWWNNNELWAETDFFGFPFTGYDKTQILTITNPPYGLGGATISECLKKSETVWALCPLPWILPKRGREFVRTFVPDLYPLSRRPGFSPDGKTSPQDYAWFRWVPDSTGQIKLIL